MLGYRYVKASPSTYVIQYKNGKAVREGTGLTFWYFAPSATLVSIPLESVDAPFMFQEVSSDFQVVTVQGQVTYRVSAPTTLASLMNFTLKSDGTYASEDRTKLPQRVVNAVQVQLRSLLQGQTLQELLRGSDHLVEVVRQGLQRADGLSSLGLELVNLSVLAVKPNPETARALEAQVREQILKQADDATYVRRNAAIEQERAVKENELNTEIAVETHSSSGLIVSTGLGSTGWFQSLLAGAAGIVGHELEDSVQALREHGFAWDADHLQFTVREPFPSRVTQVEMVFGQVTRKQPLRLVSQMAGYGVIFSDGIEADFLEFNAGMTAAISLAERFGQLVN